MNKDEVVPPSPPVKVNKSRSRTKNTTKSPRQKKRRRSILSLRMRNLQENSMAAEKSQNLDMSSRKSSEDSVDMQICGPNIYFDVSAEDKIHTISRLNEFDILGQSKLIERCDQYDLSQLRKIEPSQRFSQTRGLVSLKELLSSQDLADPETESPDIDVPCAQSLSASYIEREARDVSGENFQLSEWPVPNDYRIPIRNTVTQPIDVKLNSSHKSGDECTEHHSIINQPTVSSGSQQIIDIDQREPFSVQSIAQDEKKSAVDNILCDFVVDDDTSQETCAQWSWRLLVRRRHRKMYNRTLVAPVKRTLLFNDSSTDNVPENKDDDCDIDNTQCTQGNADLNASHIFKQNLTQLSVFLTQSKSELTTSVSADARTLTTMEEEFVEFVHEQEDFLKIYTELNNGADTQLDINNEPDAAVHDGEILQENNPSIHLDLNSDDDFLVNIDTPKSEANTKLNTVSTPLSIPKGRFRDSLMNTTPSTSKHIVSIEHRIPKRLHFGAELMDHSESPAINAFNPASSKFPGFATARGQTVHMTSAQMKRTAALFAGIDEKYSDIDPILEELPKAKKAKSSNEKQMVPDFNLNCNSSRITSEQPVIQSNNQNFGGFGKENGTKNGITATKNSLNLFGEDFNYLGYNPLPQVSFKPSTVAGSNGLGGFSTARGSNIKVSMNNMLKYTNTFKEVDRNVRAEFGCKDGINDEPNLMCKTPLSKLNQRSRAFTTSTPNSNLKTGLKNCPPITPIAKDPVENEELKSLLNLNDEVFHDIFTQMFNKSEPENARNSKTFVNSNETNASDFQLLNDSFVEKGIDVMNIHEEIKRERENTLNKQQAECFKKPQPIRPVSGSLYIQKLFTSTKLHELGYPKKYQRNELERMGIPANIIDLNVDNALQFKFDMWKFYPEDECRTNVDGIDILDEMCLIMDGNSRVGIKELTSAFLNCPPVDPKLVPDHWIKNALKWILVKLASYERSYPHRFAGTCLTPENVLVQLKYRYDREIDKVNRSAIRKIVEKDDTAAKRMVLFVSRILNKNLTTTLELSDGWYGIKTSILDAVLTKAVVNGKIVVGSKLIVQGAEIVGFEEACSPLEMPGSVALKISANSTRRARWYAKLGFCKESWPFAISLNSVNENGGIITRMKAFVLRVYPMVFMVKHKADDGYKTVFRSNKVEQRQNKKDDKKQFDVYEKLYSEASAVVEKEYVENRKKTKRRSKRKICDIEDGEELWNFMEDSNDSIEHLDLSISQIKLLEDYQTKINDEKQNKIRAIVQEKLKRMGNPTTTTPLQKVRLIDTTSPCATKTAILSIWNAGESYATLRENICLDLQNVITNSNRGKDMQLSASSYTVIRQEHSISSSQHISFARKLTPIAEINPHCFQPHFNEFDTLGFVLKIEDVTPNYAFQSVYIVDASRNVLCIQFWGSIEQCAYDDIVQASRYIVVSHLEWRRHNRYNRNGITQAFVTELTTFSESPKSEQRLSALADLKEKIDRMDMNEFIKGCCEKLGEGAQANKENSNANISSNWSINQTITNRSGAIASPAVQSPSALVVQKIDRLRQYGSPPAFRSSYLNKSNTPNGSRKPFKCPSRAQQSTDNYDKTQ